MRKLWLKVSIAAFCLLALSFSLPALAATVDCTNPATTAQAIQCGTSSSAGVPTGSQTPEQTLNTTTENLINLLSLIAGAVAVIILIVGGFRYVTSAGNAESIKNAKNTIIYGLVGLVIVAVAQIVVHFVLYNVTQSATCVKGKTGTGQKC